LFCGSGVDRISVWGREIQQGAEGDGVQEGGIFLPAGQGAVPPPQKFFDYLVLKLSILMHISGILT